MINYHIDIGPKHWLQKTGFTSAFLIKKISHMLKTLGICSAEISFVFLTSQQMIKLNQQFLQHDYDTDVLTFDFRESKQSKQSYYSCHSSMIAEIYISLGMAQENAFFYGVTLKDEILRYMAHGLLHLMGYRDKTLSEKKKMRQQEEILMRV